MKDKIHAHVDSLFEGASAAQQIKEFKEELLSNLDDKYDDLIAQGMPEQQAYDQVISGIGDIDELLRDISSAEKNSPTHSKAKRNMLSAIAAACWALGLVTCLFALFYGIGDMGFISAALLIVAGVVVMIIGSFSTISAYTKQDNTTVEEVKEQLSSKDKRAQFRKAMSSTLWLLITVLYLLVSFGTHAWHVTWLIFLAGSVLQNAILYFFETEGKKRKGALAGMYWTGVTIIYFIISFTTYAWGLSWMIFLLAAVVFHVLRLIKMWRDMP